MKTRACLKGGKADWDCQGNRLFIHSYVHDWGYLSKSEEIKERKIGRDLISFEPTNWNQSLGIRAAWNGISGRQRQFISFSRERWDEKGEKEENECSFLMASIANEKIYAVLGSHARDGEKLRVPWDTFRINLKMKAIEKNRRNSRKDKCTNIRTAVLMTSDLENFPPVFFWS